MAPSDRPRTPRLDRWSGWLSDHVSVWWALAGVVVFAVFTATVLPWQASVSSAYTDSFGAPDSSFWYTPGDLYAAAEAWGESGRSAYVRARVTFDVVWPLTYGFFLTTAIAWLIARGTRPGNRWRQIAVLPAVVVLLDYAENVCTATVMARYPSPTAVLAQLAPVFTASKWVLLAVCFALIPVCAVAAVAAAVRRFGARRA